MSSFLPALAACAAALLATGPAQEQTVQRHGVTARLRVEVELAGPAAPDGTLTVSLSGELVVTLTVDAPATAAVGPLPALAASKAWRQRDPVKGWDTTSLEDGRVRRRQTYRLTPWRLGEAPLALRPLRFRLERGQEEWEEIAWKPIPVVVTTTLRDADVRSARDITGMEELPAAEKGQERWLFLGVGLTAVVVTVAGLLLWRARNRATPPPPPDVWALAELDGLREPTNPAEVERFHTRLSEILRRYLELRFGFHAPRQTTPEFLAAARQSPLLTPEQQTLLGELLAQCDLAKFAQTQLTPEECRAGVTRARAFVEESRALAREDGNGAGGTT